MAWYLFRTGALGLRISVVSKSLSYTPRDAPVQESRLHSEVCKMVNPAMRMVSQPEFDQTMLVINYHSETSAERAFDLPLKIGGGGWRISFLRTGLHKASRTILSDSRTRMRPGTPTHPLVAESTVPSCAICNHSQNPVRHSENGSCSSEFHPRAFAILRTTAPGLVIILVPAGRLRGHGNNPRCRSNELSAQG